MTVERRELIHQGSVRAGQDDRPTLDDGPAALYVTTGSRLPVGADAVVGIEQVVVDKARQTVSINDNVRVVPGAYVRTPGSDIAQGQRVLAQGSTIDSGAIGILHALGISHVLVARVPTVAVFSTGDELLAATSSDAAGSLGQTQVFDANGPMLIAAVAEAGGTSANGGVLPDTAEGTKAGLVRAVNANEYDIVVTTGGVSRGVADHVKPSLESMGQLLFGELHLKPGKPTAFATIKAEGGRTKLVFGLPGNPVSAYATFHLLVRPAIRALLGCAQEEYPRVSVITTEDISPDAVRPEYRRVTLYSEPGSRTMWAEPTTRQQRSANIASVAAANGLLLVPPGTSTLPKGSRLNAVQLGLPCSGRPASVGALPDARNTLGLTAAQQQAAEASSFRKLIAWLQDRTDVQNIDIMNLAGFCRNCFSKWLKVGAEDALREAGESPSTVSVDAAKEVVYGMPYGEWKKKYQTPLKPGQLDPHAKARGGPTAGSAAPTARPCAGHVLDAAKAASTKAPAPAMQLSIGVLTVSDRAHSKVYQDTSGPAVRAALQHLCVDDRPAWTVARWETAIVPDEIDAIQARLTDWCDTQALDLVVTTGGTGFAPRDVTPEAVAPLLTKQAPGLTHRMWSEGQKHTPLAVLSRAVCGVRGSTVVVCVPGSQEAAVQAVSSVSFALPRAVGLARGDKV